MLQWSYNIHNVYIVEPDLFRDPAKYSAQEIAENFVSLVKLIRSFDCLNSSRIVGPDVGSPHRGKDIVKE